MLTADSIASEHPDSAAALLKDLDGKTVDAPEAVRMRYGLIRQKQIAYSFGRLTSDSAARALVEYYETRGELSRPGLRNRPYGHMERNGTPCHAKPPVATAGRQRPAAVTGTANKTFRTPCPSGTRVRNAAWRQRHPCPPLFHVAHLDKVFGYLHGVECRALAYLVAREP